jgi:type II secretory pathway component PulK
MTQRSSFRRQKPPHAHRPKGGAVMVAALVCLLIVMSILGSMLHAALRAQRQLRVERDRRQVEFLLQAGVNRAVERLSTDSAFRGDTWSLPTEAIVGRGRGSVSSEVSPASNEQSWQIRIVAEYPAGSEWSIRRSRSFLVPAP